MALNCTRAGTCTCDCLMCRYKDHSQCSFYKHRDGCHIGSCSPPAKGTK